eukprot:TRINITY_DN26626_c0_g1_i2.p1 TRINITY_DN26626_c0_g1~~TRINITY_DN26626_c0_g1_i2.p1  ORF type:complete len:254 (-),score=35.65 TRINITY_DN26626_c0_g1_i2:28-789(-)
MESPPLVKRLKLEKPRRNFYLTRVESEPASASSQASSRSQATQSNVSRSRSRSVVSPVSPGKREESSHYRRRDDGAQKSERSTSGYYAGYFPRSPSQSEVRAAGKLSQEVRSSPTAAPIGFLSHSIRHGPPSPTRARLDRNGKMQLAPVQNLGSRGYTGQMKSPTVAELRESGHGRYMDPVLARDVSKSLDVAIPGYTGYIPKRLGDPLKETICGARFETRKQAACKHLTESSAKPSMPETMSPSFKRLGGVS